MLKSEFGTRQMEMARTLFGIEILTSFWSLQDIVEKSNDFSLILWVYNIISSGDL